MYQALTKKIEIAFQPHGKRGKFIPGVNVMDAAKAIGVDISSLCGGLGKCGKCRVKVLGDSVCISELEESEKKNLSKEEIKNGTRLSCMTYLCSPAIIQVPATSRIGSQRLQTQGLEIQVDLDPQVKKYWIKMNPPTIYDSISDEDRILFALNKKQVSPILEIDLEVYRLIPQILRNSHWSVTAVVWKDQIIALESGDTTNRSFGLAVDIGTTKLAGYLIDLNDGSIISIAARMNPQIQFGEDVMSRVSHILINGDNTIWDLQNAVVSGVNEIILECCEKADVSHEEIYEVNFVGNTVMQLLLLGISPRHVVSAPYTPALRRGVDVKASTLGIAVNPNANAHHLPIIGGFVGADNVAMLLASGIFESDETMMTIDIGTNTEIDLGNKKLVMADSCASGPAFEGMHIKFGMRATSGSIEKISINPETLDVFYKTIGDLPPIGICGSGIVDAPAELLKAGIILSMGNFVTEIVDRTKRLRKGSDGWEFVIAWKNETAIDKDIVVTLRDIREIQKAKAAIHTGADLLMRKMDVEEADISRLVIAGAFGNYIDPENARIIGMYPEIPLDRIEFAGNLAGTGARMTLINKEIRKKAENIYTKVKYHELAADKNFQKEYLDSLKFPHSDLTKYPETIALLRRLGQKI